MQLFIFLSVIIGEQNLHTMATKQQNYKLTVKCTGNTGKGTTDKDSYERSHEVIVKGKQKLRCSSDSNYKGDKSKNNPEDLLLASLSACHMLWFLHFCAIEGVVVIDYVDNAEGKMIQTTNGAGYFTEAILNPTVIVQHSSMINSRPSKSQFQALIIKQSFKNDF